MVKSSDGGLVSVAPFLKKCYEMVDDGSTDSIISWSKSSDSSFVIWDKTEFTVQLLPKYFKHSNCSSFVRQLNIYGFRKIDTDRWEFANEAFIRGQKHLLASISRRKNSQSSDQRKPLQHQENSVGSCETSKTVALWKEVENLKTDKSALTQELVKLRQHQEATESKLLLLKDSVQGMEKDHQQMLSFLIMAMQSPGFLFQLLQPKEKNWRKAEASNMLEDIEPLASESMIVRYHPSMNETSKPVLPPVVESGKHKKTDSSDGVREFWMGTDFMKVLMDETNIPFAPPDLHDDGAWEKLFLGSPCRENNEEMKLDNEGSNGSGMEVEEVDSDTDQVKSRSFELMLQHMGQTQNLDIESATDGSQNVQNLQLLTEKMGHLTSTQFT